MEPNTTLVQRDIASLRDELARVQRDVRAKPADEKLRTYLFQLLAVLGQWRRALEQLQVCAQLSATAIPMAQTYREAIRSEIVRNEVFAGKRAPQILGEPPSWIGALVQAMQRLAAGEAEAAAKLRDVAFEEASVSSGKVNERETFAWIADADSRLGPVCECIVNGQYYWVPFGRVRTLRIDVPTDLRDLVWAPAQITFANGGEQIALIPARYPESEAADDDALKLARRTQWRDIGLGAYAGLGQKMIATDEAEHGLLDVRRIDIDNATG